MPSLFPIMVTIWLRQKIKLFWFNIGPIWVELRRHFLGNIIPMTKKFYTNIGWAWLGIIFQFNVDSRFMSQILVLSNALRPTIKYQISLHILGSANKSVIYCSLKEAANINFYPCSSVFSLGRWGASGIQMGFFAKWRWLYYRLFIHDYIYNIILFN